MSVLRTQNIAVSGATGLVGSNLVLALKAAGHQVQALCRKPAGPDSILWDAVHGLAKPQQFETIETVVHLAGENIAGARWTKASKERIRNSRVEGTRALVKSMAAIENRPKTLICASATGFYGDRGDEILTESSAVGTGYLADVCRDWEAEAMAAEELGVRVVRVRIGVVLTPKGGALAKMLLPFKLGAGGIIGSGKQYWSWIGLNDLVRVLKFSVEDESIRGPVNAVSPSPMTNFEFTKGVGKVLRRPTIFPMPAFMARIVLGEMADALLLSSARVLPEKLTEHGFQFAQPTLAGCLEHELS